MDILDWCIRQSLFWLVLETEDLLIFPLSKDGKKANLLSSALEGPSCQQVRGPFSLLKRAVRVFVNFYNAWFETTILVSLKASALVHCATWTTMRCFSKSVQQHAAYH